MPSTNFPTATDSTYDVVIVGARAAGAATAMLLAQRGVRVLAVDKQRYASDTLSTHALMRGAVDSLHRWGLLDQVLRDTPTIRRTVFRYGSDETALDVKPRPGIPGLAAPRRTALDPILVNAARDAGAEIRHQTSLVSLNQESDGRVTGAHVRNADGRHELIRTGMVIGADGLRSKVASLVDASITHQGSESSAYIVKYFTDLRMPRDSYRWSYNSGTGTGVIPTNDRSHVVFAAMTRDRFVAEARGDIDLAFKTVIAETDGPLASVIGTANTVGATRSWPGVPGHFRKPYGPGWALVGDAGYFKDPFAAHGISDAFRDAELLADAIVTDSLPGYEKNRDELSMPLFTALESIASYSWDLESLPGMHWELSKAMKQEGAALEALRAPQLVAA